MRSTRAIQNCCVYFFVFISFVVNTHEECNVVGNLCTENNATMHMDCSSKELRVIDLKRGTSNCEDYTVDWSNNNIENLEKSYEDLNSFKVIDLSMNYISNFTPSRQDALNMKVEELNVSHNNVKILHFNDLPTLRYLDASYNKLNHIECNAELVVLNASHNKGRLDFNLCSCKSLEHLDLSHSSPEFLSKKCFQDTSLKTLILSNTSIKDVSIFSNIGTLDFLDLSDNNISDISNLNLSSKIRFVNFSSNSIVRIETFMENLQTIALKNITHTIDFRKNIILSESDYCSCVNVTSGVFLLHFCVNSVLSEQCLLDKGSQTDFSTTIASTAVHPAKIITNDSSANSSHENNSQVTPPTDGSATHTNQTAEVNITSPLSHASYFLMSLGAAKLSFLGFLLLTLIVLIVINYIVGDPVVDDYWWEEKQPGDRPVT